MNFIRVICNYTWIFFVKFGRVCSFIFHDIFRVPKSGRWWFDQIAKSINLFLDDILLNYKHRSLGVKFIAGYKQKDIDRLKLRSQGLHRLLPPDSRMSFSVLMPVYKPVPQYFETALLHCSINLTSNGDPGWFRKISGLLSHGLNNIY